MTMFVTKAVCTIVVALLVALFICIKSKSSVQRKAFVLVLCAFTVLILSAESCDDTPQPDSSNGCKNGVVLNDAKTQYVCAPEAKQVQQVVIDNTTKAVDQAKQAIEQKANEGYKDSMKDSPIQKAAPAIQQATGQKPACKNGTYKMGSQEFCNP